MSSIFRKDDSISNNPKRNVFDMSFQNNFTTKFGQLLPVFCQEVLPGDSFKIDPTFALRYMPQKFPVQTRQKAHLHFFYCRNRAVWDEWIDFIGKTKETSAPPYIKMDGLNRENYLKTGSLGDMFGFPTVLYDNGVYRKLTSVPCVPLTNSLSSQRGYFDFETGQFCLVDFETFISVKQNWVNYVYQKDSVFLFRKRLGSETAVNAGDLLNPIIYKLPQPLKYSNSFAIVYRIGSAASKNNISIIFKGLSNDGVTFYGLRRVPLEDSTSFIDSKDGSFAVKATFSNLDGGTVANGKIVEILGFISDSTSNVYDLQIAFDFDLQENSPYDLINVLPEMLPFPYINGNIGDTIQVSSLPFRHYESIYNSFYRNAENNPYMLNGVPEYNKYIRSTAGGADMNHYAIRYRNWEDDFLTTALPTPQQGNAPIVGLTGVSDANVEIANEDGTKTHLVLKTDTSGNVQMVLPSGTTSSEDIRPFVEMANFGITINDFRNVNSLQKWLENNIRKGYKYRDQIKAHYGVTVRYDELLMPEFIGGVSRDVSVNQVTQTTENQYGNLGDIAGQSYVMGEGQSIHHYCDEHGYIIGILSVVPSANYSQMMPKHMLKTSTFDFFFPEFGKIGYQPISNKEVTLLQSWLDDNMNECFGYQRPWYDYLARTDEVHGLFRTELSNFVISRVFGSTPQLGSDFTTVHPDSITNTFYVDDGNDKILGQIFFNVSAKRPIPEYGIPSLE